MAEYQLPEMLRLPLEELCLRIKVYGYDSIEAFLAEALDPPRPGTVETAIQLLQEVGALDDKQDLTPLGEHIAKLPVDVRLAKMLIYAAIFRCLDPVLTIAAVLSYKSIFLRPFDKQQEADKAMRSFATGKSQSSMFDFDLFTQCTRSF
jgi:HrpA-like RNA helicase